MEFEFVLSGKIVADVDIINQRNPTPTVSGVAPAAIAGIVWAAAIAIKRRQSVGGIDNLRIASRRRGWIDRLPVLPLAHQRFVLQIVDASNFNLGRAIAGKVGHQTQISTLLWQFE